MRRIGPEELIPDLLEQLLHPFFKRNTQPVRLKSNNREMSQKVTSLMNLLFELNMDLYPHILNLVRNSKLHLFLLPLLFNKQAVVPEPLLFNKQ